MTKIYPENEVTIESLVAHMADSGLLPTGTNGEHVWFRTPCGIAYSISIIEEKKFVRIGTYLPLDRTKSRDEKLAFEHRLNRDLFPPTFSLDEADDLNVSYSMPYAFGLIAGQFIAMVNRFASMLKFVVEVSDTDDLIDFGTSPEDEGPEKAVNRDAFRQKPTSIH